jgi:hypothetical protein
VCAIVVDVVPIIAIIENTQEISLLGKYSGFNLGFVNQ